MQYKLIPSFLKNLGEFANVYNLFLLICKNLLFYYICTTKILGVHHEYKINSGLHAGIVCLRGDFICR